MGILRDVRTRCISSWRWGTDAMPPTDTGNIVVGALGVLNLGVLVYVVRIVIAPIAQITQQLTKSVDELYRSRDCHEVKITRIDTIHTIRGCDKPPEKE